MWSKTALHADSSVARSSSLDLACTSTNELTTMAEVLKEFAQQQMEGCSGLVFSEDLRHFG